MSENRPTMPPPGWYPDPTGQQRWWDGAQWGQAAQANPAPPPPSDVPSGIDPKTMAMLAYLLSIFAGWVGPLVIYLVNGDKDPFVRHHSAEALNFQITKFIAVICCVPLMFLLVGFLLLPLVLIGALVLEIMGAMAANRGEWWKFPINIRMVPGALG